MVCTSRSRPWIACTLLGALASTLAGAALIDVSTGPGQAPQSWAAAPFLFALTPLALFSHPSVHGGLTASVYSLGYWPDAHLRVRAQGQTLVERHAPGHGEFCWRPMVCIFSWPGKSSPSAPISWSAWNETASGAGLECGVGSTWPHPTPALWPCSLFSPPWPRGPGAGNWVPCSIDQTRPPLAGRPRLCIKAGVFPRTFGCPLPMPTRPAVSALMSAAPSRSVSTA